MAEPPDDTPRPRPPLTPGTPLPRLYRSEPPAASPSDRDEEGTASRPRKSKRKAGDEAEGRPSKKKQSKAKAGEEKEGVLVEATPFLETAEGRRAVRILVGCGILLVFVLGGVLLSRAISPREPKAPPTGGSPEFVAGEAPGVSGPDRNRMESEAGAMLDRAREVARNGNRPQAVSLLKRLVTAYASTKVAADARAALDRDAAGKPLFPGTVIQAETATSSPPASPPVQVKVEPERPKPRPAPGVNAVAVTLPAANAEPHRDTGIKLPTAEVPARPLPRGFVARTEVGVHPSGWPLEIVSQLDGATMVLIPGGTFPMGRDDGAPEEQPEHSVALSPYYIDQHEVTVRQYKRFLEDQSRRGQRARPLPKDLSTACPTDDHPMVLVTLREALAYARWAGKTLPTEAQWEMAGRTTDGRLFPWGDDPPRWDRPRAPRQLDPVMSFANDLSPYNVFDLAGNAAEWTSDAFDARYYQRFRPGVTARDPRAPTRGHDQQAIRGGSKVWNVTWRSGMKEDARVPYLGFRCALPLGQSAAPAGPGPAPGPGPANAPPAVPGGQAPL